MLLPREPGEALGEEDLTDPRAELIRQLLEYKKFKDAANLLAAAADERGERFNRPDTIIEQIKGASEPAINLDQLSIWDLLEAFDKIMEATGAKFDISRISDDTPIDLYQIEILHRLQTEGPMNFARIFENRQSRLIMVGLFLAILELIRSQLVHAEQPEADSSATTNADSTPDKDIRGQASSPQAGSSIYLRTMTREPAEEAVRKAILAIEAAANGERKTEDGERKTEEETQNPDEIREHQMSNVESEEKGQPAIPIVEIPAEEKKQSAQQLEPKRGEMPQNQQ
jgi:chromatin segregation and condensation protein Rec8/ScpA/Scc1 (kleisin family)